MNDTSSLDPRAKRLGNIAKYIFLVLGLAVFGPIIWLAVGGLIGLILLGGIWTATWMLRPWVFSKAANLRLKLIKHEAAVSPIETLSEEHRKQTIALNERKQGVETMAGAIKTLDQAIDSLQADFPDSAELPQMRADQAELENLLDARREDWKQAYVTLGEFAKEIQRVGKLWDVSLAAAKARQQSGLTEDEWLSKLKTQTAIDAVRTNLNTQLAALNTENMQAEADRILKGKTAAKALPAPNVQAAIDIPSIKSAIPVR